MEAAATLSSSPTGSILYQDPEYVASYDEGHYGGDFGRFIQDREIKAFRALLTSGRERLLDVGSGTGKLALAFGEHFSLTVAADRSLAMLRTLKRKASEAGIEVQCVLCDAEMLSFREGSFDTLMASRLLMHLDDVDRALAEFCRVADELVIDFPSTASLAGAKLKLQKAISHLRRPAHIPHAFTLGEVRDSLEGMDQTVFAWSKEFFLPIAVHRYFNRANFTRRIEDPLRALGLTNLLGAPITLRAGTGDG